MTLAFYTSRLKRNSMIFYFYFLLFLVIILNKQFLHMNYLILKAKETSPNFLKSYFSSFWLCIRQGNHLIFSKKFWRVWLEQEGYLNFLLDEKTFVPEFLLKTFHFKYHLSDSKQSQLYHHHGVPPETWF